MKTNKLMSRSNISFWLVLGMVAVFGFAVGVRAEQIKEPAADFTLPSNQGKNLRLEDYRGQVVLVNFWASWCGPCRQEMPLMDELFQQYEDLGFTILAINVDQDSKEAEAFLKSVPVSFPVLFDRQSQVSELYAVDAMPTTVLIDRDGQKRLLHRGYKSGDEHNYQQHVKQLIRE